MTKIFLLGLFFTIFEFCAISQDQNQFGLYTNISYKWDKVTNIDLYYSPNKKPYCDTENMREIVEDSTFSKPCNWRDLLDLIKDCNKEGGDVYIEKECIAIEVDFGNEKIVFAVYLQQGVLFDLTKNTFQFLYIPDKDNLKKIIEECLK